MFFVIRQSSHGMSEPHFSPSAECIFSIAGIEYEIAMERLPANGTKAREWIEIRVATMNRNAISVDAHIVR